MSSIILKPALNTQHFVTRPKVHRLPPVSSYRVYGANRRNKPFIFAGLAVLLAAGIFLAEEPLLGHSTKNSLNVVTLPAIVVSSHDGSMGNASLIGDAQASVNNPARINTTHSNQSGNMISLHNNSEYIVGQMTKFPAENEQITEIKPANDIDKPAGRELLSIISKY